MQCNRRDRQNQKILSLVYVCTLVYIVLGGKNFLQNILFPRTNVHQCTYVHPIQQKLS